MNSCVLGAGAWGTALSLHLMKKGHSVSLAPRRMEQALDLASNRENKAYLPEIKLPDSLQIGFELEPLLMEADVLYFACPSKGLRSLCQRIQSEVKSIDQLQAIVLLCKGLELDSTKFPSEVVQEYFPQIPISVLSGPSNAREVALGNPTALSLGVQLNREESIQIQKQISSDCLRVYLTEDIRGVELGGVLKNVYAIGAGFCDGLQLGDNAKAAFITRALNEMIQIGCEFGGHKETFFGLSGSGDLMATCFGQWSRNRTFGETIAKGKSPQAILSEQQTVVEGYHTIQCLFQMTKKKALSFPILNELYAILYDNKSVEDSMYALMRRDLKSE